MFVVIYCPVSIRFLVLLNLYLVTFRGLSQNSGARSVRLGLQLETLLVLS